MADYTERAIKHIYKAGIYTMTLNVPDRLRNTIPEDHIRDDGGLPEETMTFLSETVPELTCDIVRRKSKWSRRRTRTVPVKVFIPHLPCEYVGETEQAVDAVFWEHGEAEAVSLELLQRRRRAPRLSSEWRMCFQLEAPKIQGRLNSNDSWSVSFWLQNVFDPSLKLPITDKCLNTKWIDPAVGLSKKEIKDLIESELDYAFDVCPLLHRIEKDNPELSARTRPRPKNVDLLGWLDFSDL